MSAQARLDYWRSERLRLLKELADDPSDDRRRRTEHAANLIQTESFIRYYEAKTARHWPDPANIVS